MTNQPQWEAPQLLPPTRAATSQGGTIYEVNERTVNGTVFYGPSGVANPE